MKDSCWEWSGYIRPNGYGRMTIYGKQFYPHRVAYEAFKGSIPTGFDVCHKCDNRRCINPDHLFIGTRSDNMKDAMLKGRLQRGESRWNSKMTADKVREFRLRTKAGEAIKDLAEHYGVSVTTLRRIKNGKSWRHVI